MDSTNVIFPTLRGTREIARESGAFFKICGKRLERVHASNALANDQRVDVVRALVGLY